MKIQQQPSYSILEFTAIPIHYNITTFYQHIEHNQQTYFNSFLATLGIEPEKHEVSIKKAIVKIHDDNKARDKAKLNLYIFDTQPEITKKDFVILYSHGGSIRPEASLKSVLIPSLFSYLKSLNYNLMIISVDHRGSHTHWEKQFFSLADRVNDLWVANDIIKNQLGEPREKAPHLLMGNSMGGHVCCLALEMIQPTALILLNPAAYSAEAHYTNLGDSFKKIISKNYSWINSFAFTNLMRYLALDHQCLLHANPADKVIPKEISQKYCDILLKYPANGKIYTQSNPQHQAIVANDILDLSQFLGQLKNTFLIKPTLL